MPRPITDDETQHWLRHGYVVVDDFVAGSELERMLADVAEIYPTAEQRAADPAAYEHVAQRAFDWVEFPFKGDTLSDLAFAPELLDFAGKVLDGEQPFLTHCVLWPKYAGAHDYEQALHVDYANNTLVYPRDEGRWWVIPFILYLSDVTTELGPTWVVSQELTGTDVATITHGITADSHPDALERQHPVTAKAGSLLIYTLRTFHRGSAFTADSGHRFTLNFGYRAASLPWAGHSARWPGKAAWPDMVRFLARATPAQRAVLGFPLPGDPYWNEETIAGVAARYPDLDMTPYRTAG